VNVNHVVGCVVTSAVAAKRPWGNVPTMRLAMTLSLLLACVLAAASECGKIPCTSADPSVCGDGGRCNDVTNECEAIPPGEGNCDLNAFGEPAAEPLLVVRDAVLSYDHRDSAFCVSNGLGSPFTIVIEIDGPIDFSFDGDEVLFSIDGGPPEVQCPLIFESFEVNTLTSECDGEDTCFFLCRTCFEETPLTIGAIVVGEGGESGAPLSLPSCADATTGLVDSDCDSIVDIDEIILGTLVDNVDSDGDGVQDGVEHGGEFCGDVQCSCVLDADPDTNTNPGNVDSDGDGLEDGEEDANQNGAIDKGETDPSEAN
jgi:hypothetical protein